MFRCDSCTITKTLFSHLTTKFILATPLAFNGRQTRGLDRGNTQAFLIFFFCFFLFYTGVGVPFMRFGFLDIFGEYPTFNLILT